MNNKFKEDKLKATVDKLIEMGYKEVDKHEYHAMGSVAKVFIRTGLPDPHGRYFIAHPPTPLKGEYLAVGSSCTWWKGASALLPPIGPSLLEPAGIDASKALGKKFKVTVEEVIE